MLEIRNINKSYSGRKILNDVSAVFEEGKISVICGSNGSGKTTLLRCIAGIIRPEKGEVSYRGRELRKKETGYLPEKGALYQNCSVQQHLKLAAGLKGLDKLRTEARINEVLRLLHGENLRSRQICDLSKGNRQKIRLACALINDPAVLLLDEPFTALDQDNEQTLFNVIQILKQRKKAVLLSCHDPKIISMIADEVFLIREGTIHTALGKELWEKDNRKALDLEVNEEFFTMEKYQQTNSGIRIIAENEEKAFELFERYRKDANVLRISIGPLEPQDYFPGNNS